MKKNGLITLEELTNKISTYDSSINMELLRKAYYFTSDAHCKQTREEGTPFIGHPLSVAYILADMHLDCKAIIAGLLHDTVEDTETGLKDIEEIFGSDVSFIVDALTKLDKVEFKTKEDANAENFRKMILAMSKDVRVIMIKFADRLHNMRTLEYLPLSKRQRIASETLEVYAPLANRLGIGWLRTELEDQSFKHIYPEMYDKLIKKVAKKRKDQEGYLYNIAQIVRKKLNEQCLHGIVSGRVKHYYGIYQKMQRQRIPFDEVHDVLGLRIITDKKADCYAILGLIHSLWMPVPGRIKDHIAMPKSNMYQSLHTTVIGPKGERVEFQIRTEEMNRIAEDGIASHWLYKEKDNLKDKDTRYIEWLRELIHSQKDMGDAREFLEMIKGEVFPDAIYALTPVGEIKELPVGATPIDFAYAIHTDVGNRIVGARINGRIVPLRYKLQNGDTVEIITSKSHAPRKDWLNFVVTHKAKNRIKHWIRTEEREQGIVLGRKIFESELRKQGLRVSKMKSEEMNKIIKSFNLKSMDDLLIAIGYGKISAHHVVNKLKGEEKPIDRILLKLIKPLKLHEGLKIEGMGNIMYSLAKCCYPVPGDSLVGFITKGKGVTIHRRECHNLQRFNLDDARLIDVSWKANDKALSQARLYIETIDKPGMLAKLSALISSLNINLAHLDAHSTQDRHAHFTFVLEVKNKPQLLNLNRKLMSSEGVISVRR